MPIFENFDTSQKHYHKVVTGLARDASGLLISNSDEQHAKSLLWNLFDNANQEMRIFSRCLYLYRDRNLVDIAEAFVKKRETRLLVLLQDSDMLRQESEKEPHPLFVMLRNYPDKAIVRETVTEADKNKEEHMVVMDGVGYRFCPNRDDTKAIASFNRPEVAQSLATKFDTIFGRSSAFNFAGAMTAVS